MDGNNNTFAQTPANGNDLHLNPAAQAGLTEEQIENPQTGREYYLDSLAAILQENIGQPVTCECDVYSLKFITFYEPRNGGNPTMRFDSQGRPVSGSNMMQNNAPNAFPNMSPNNRSSF